MARRKNIKHEELEELRVKLKPLLGIEPGVYLTVIYAAALAVILFFILLYPGIRNNGSKVTVTSRPENIRVFVDGTYAGATPCTVFIPRGERTITLEREYFEPVQQQVAVKGRLFGSLFFPRKMNLDFEPTISDTSGFLSDAFEEAASWAMIDSYHANYQKPPVITDSVQALLDAKAPPAAVTAFLDASAALVRSEPMLADYMKALTLAETFGGILAPANILEVVQKYIQKLEAAPAFLFWLPEALSSEHRSVITDEEWFRSSMIAYNRRMAEYPEGTPSAFSEIYVENLRFIGIRGGSFVMGKESGSEYRIPAGVDDFYILDREVTRRMYARFLADEAEWRRTNLDGLMEKGLVTEEYLKDFDSPETDDPPVRYVSHHAADAFCRWLESALPDRLDGWTVRLPGEAEWEWASLADEPDGGTFQTGDRSGPVAAASVNSLGIFDLSGNLWEWCENWYYPAEYMVREGPGPANNSPTRHIPQETGAEKAVRGGSWANRRDDVNIRTRGSQPADWCTPFTGFRPVIVRE